LCILFFWTPCTVCVQVVNFVDFDLEDSEFSDHKGLRSTDEDCD
jgi:hypothetical protein